MQASYHPSSLLRRVSSMMLTTLVLVLLADRLFYGHPLGWTLGGFAWALLILLIARHADRLRDRGRSPLLEFK